MKALVKKAMVKGVSNERIWKLLDATFLKAARHADFVRREFQWRKSNLELVSLISDQMDSFGHEIAVRHGMFAGMRYPDAQSFGSALYPKIIGSYEAELAPVFDQLLSKSFNRIINIGCADGYYAVGMAMKMPTAVVYAYDTSKNATDQCRRMAEMNGVSDRVIIGGEFCAETLRQIDLGNNALIICDCEGCESDIFTDDAVYMLDKTELIIETHDFIDITISRTLKERFRRTHHIRSIKSIDDIEKAQTYDFAELDRFDLDVRKRLLAEWRPAIMEWLYLQPSARKE